MFSAGQIISAPLFGYWSNHVQKVKEPIIIALLIMLFGNLLYVGLEVVPFIEYVLLLSRFFIGFGSCIVFKVYLFYYCS